MKYRTRSLNILRSSLCESCHKRPVEWDDQTYLCWTRYINGADRNDLIKNTRFSSYISPRYYFRMHPCYTKIAKIRKRWFVRINGLVEFNLEDYPWLLGIYYADGSKHAGTQLSFALGINELIIANRVKDELKTILGQDFHIVIERIDNMYNVRTHNIELCDYIPDKNDYNKFLVFWNNLTDENKLKFIAGYIDGDGSCSFEDKIFSINLFIKSVPFLLKQLKEFLTNYGYVSSKGYSMYISPNVGRIIYRYTMKKHIRNPYQGSVDVNKAFALLKKGNSVRKTAKMMNYDKKTITLAIRRKFGTKVDKYIMKHRKNKIMSKI